MINRNRVIKLTVCTFVTLLIGCGTSVPERVDRTVAIDLIRDGQLVLGSPSLTAGIPGDGPLRIPDLQRWLANAGNHQELDVVLPLHLVDSSDQPDLPSDNRLTRAKIELGRQLFFDQRLSGIGTFSCGTCHRPEQSFSSYQVMPEVGRNASSVINRVLGSEHFWDGRSSLEEQPLSPIKNPFEMNSSPERSTEKIRSIPGYALQFEVIYGEVSFENICKSLACFERTLVVGESDWDRQTMSEAASRGEKLFFSERLRCGECHTGRNLTDEQYHNLGTVRLANYDDVGRSKVTGDVADTFAFKTPTLRNVARTPPYMHNGALPTLESVVEFFDQGGHVDTMQRGVLNPLKLTASEKHDLVEFLQALSGEMPFVRQDRLPE